MKVKADRDEASPYAAMLAAQDVAVRCKVRTMSSDKAAHLNVCAFCSDPVRVVLGPDSPSFFLAAGTWTHCPAYQDARDWWQQDKKSWTRRTICSACTFPFWLEDWSHWGCHSCAHRQHPQKGWASRSPLVRIFFFLTRVLVKKRSIMFQLLRPLLCHQLDLRNGPYWFQFSRFLRVNEQNMFYCPNASFPSPIWKISRNYIRIYTYTVCIFLLLPYYYHYFIRSNEVMIIIILQDRTRTGSLHVGRHSLRGIDG